MTQPPNGGAGEQQEGPTPGYPAPVDPFAAAPADPPEQPAVPPPPAHPIAPPPAQPAVPPPPTHPIMPPPPAQQVVPPQQPGYPQPGYPPPGYTTHAAAPGYPPAPGYQQPGYPTPESGYPPQQPGYPAPQLGAPAPQPGYPPPPDQPGYPPQQVPGQPYPAPVSGGPYAPPTSGQPYPGQPTSGQPTSGQPTSGQPFSPGYPQPAPGYPVDPTYAQPGYPGAPAPPRKKSRIPMILAIVGVAAVLLCGGGVAAAVMLMRNTEPNDGAAEPVAAVQDFLKAVYEDQDVTKANDKVCAESRDEPALTTKIDEVKGNATKYKSPRYKWDEPKVDSQDTESAIVSVNVTMTTSDEKVAEQQFKFTVVQKTGWFVCEIGS